MLGLPVIAETVRRKLTSVVDGRLDVMEFERWLITATWDRYDDLDQDCRTLVGATQLAIAEYTSGHRNFDELMATLGRLRDTEV